MINDLPCSDACGEKTVSWGSVGSKLLEGAGGWCVDRPLGKQWAEALLTGALLPEAPNHQVRVDTATRAPA